MRRQKPNAYDDDSIPVMVPRSEKALVPTAPERVRRLHRHLMTILLASKASVNQTFPPGKPGPQGFAARVAGAACALCKGSCCKNGDDDAFLDVSTMTRVRQARPELDLPRVAQLYTQLVPNVGYEGSCVFHGAQGCTLDRSLRSDVCNDFFCAGLDAHLRSGDPDAPVTIMAGEGDKMRTSPILLP